MGHSREEAALPCNLQADIPSEVRNLALPCQCLCDSSELAHTSRCRSADSQNNPPVQAPLVFNPESSQGKQILTTRSRTDGRRPPIQGLRQPVAVRQYPDDFVILLVDSEGPVKVQSAWAHLQAKDMWLRPADTIEDQAHLMVQCMESWFLADPEALRTYYNQGFLIRSLPRRRNIEEIPKRNVARALAHATRPTQKGVYHKTRHGFDLLALIDPTRLREASGRAQRLFAVLEQRARV
jgi:Domain of unknown function (DUF4276)